MFTQLKKTTSAQAFLFLCVGTVGFIIDATVLSILIFEFGLGRYIARAISFLVAVPCTWMLNRNLTFRKAATANRTREYSVYLFIQSTGAFLNFSVYSACIFFSSLMFDFPVLALGIASVTAALFNFAALQRYAFTGNRD
jgi:putative flippase GtrA